VRLGPEVERTSARSACSVSGDLGSTSRGAASYMGAYAWECEWGRANRSAARNDVQPCKSVILPEGCQNSDSTFGCGFGGAHLRATARSRWIRDDVVLLGSSVAAWAGVPVLRLFRSP
jgi:hypothetical protein